MKAVKERDPDKAWREFEEVSRMLDEGCPNIEPPPEPPRDDVTMPIRSMIRGCW